MLPKMRMLRKSVFVWMFKNKYTVIGKKSFLEHHFRQRGYPFMAIWRIGKDNIKAAVGPFEQVEYICPYNMQVGNGKPRGTLFDKIGAWCVDVHSCNLFGTTRYELY